MTDDRAKYLLRTKPQIDAFRKKYAKLIEQRSGEYVRWIRSLPLMKWIALTLRPEEVEPVIGLICILYIDRRVNITFSDDMRSFRNEPLDDAEEQRWMKAMGFRRKQKKEEGK